jgi:periplasmic protein TonB
MKKNLIILLFFVFQIANAQNTSDGLPKQKPKDESIYNTSNIEVKPDYPGGINEFYKYIGKKYRVPNVKGLSGKVFVCFVVEKDGSLTDIKVIRDIGYGSGEEAIRVLKKCKKWSPGLQNGKKVRVLFSLPINIMAN